VNLRTFQPFNLSTFKRSDYEHDDDYEHYDDYEHEHEY